MPNRLGPSCLLSNHYMKSLASAGLAFALFTAIPPFLEAQQPKDSLDKDYAAELPRIAATEPKAALKAFHVAAGFRIEQVAAEPLVADPVAIAFDENYRLYVVEMRGYSEN